MLLFDGVFGPGPWGGDFRDWGAQEIGCRAAQWGERLERH